MKKMKIVIATSILASTLPYISAGCMSPLIQDGKCFGYQYRRFSEVECDSETAKNLKIATDGRLCKKKRCLVVVNKNSKKFKFLPKNKTLKSHTERLC